MRNTSESAASKVPRWSLWLVAAVCVGPLIVQGLLGVLLFPFWVATLVFQVAEPERFAHESSGSIWDFAWPMGLVASGFIGLVGLIRVLTLSHRERPKAHRVFTLGTVAVGLAPLLIFDGWIVAGAVLDVSEGVPVAALAIYVVLPLTGAAWLLAKSWRYLFAGPTHEPLHVRKRATRSTS
jgi:hypothetical protein